MTSLAATVMIFAALLQTPSPAQQPTPDVVSLARAALDAMAAADFAKIEAQFTAEMKAALPPDQLAAGWAAVQQQAAAGPWPAVVLVHGSGPNDCRLNCRLNCRLGLASGDWPLPEQRATASPARGA